MKREARYKYRLIFWLSILLALFIIVSSLLAFLKIQEVLTQEARRAGSNTLTTCRTSRATYI